MEKLVLETVQWSSLPDIDEVPPISDTDYDVLNDIGNLIRRHGLEERFGICLLHSHFELNESEALIEETDVEKRLLITKVCSEGEMSDKTIETMWRFPKGTESVTECKKKCDYNSGHKEIHIQVGG